MSALSEALPLALAAAVYPPAIVVLLLLMSTGDPRRLTLAYFGGAALSTIGSGLIGLAVLTGAGLTRSDSRTVSGWAYIAAGLLLLVLSAWAWRRRERVPDPEGAGVGRIATWSRRATGSRRWAFVLGIAMYLPSPLYLLAVKEIGDSGDSSSSQVLAVLVCAIAVMLFVEVPVVAMFVRPGSVAAGLGRFNEWLSHHGWTVVAALALAAGVYAILTGVVAL